MKSIQEKAREYADGYLTQPERNAAFNAYIEGYRLGYKDHTSRDDHDLSFIPPGHRDYIPLMTEWITYRKEIKKPFRSRQSIRKCWEQLNQLSDGDPVTARQIIDQSIANGWQGLFPLKQNNNHDNRNSQRRETAPADGIFAAADSVLQSHLR